MADPRNSEDPAISDQRQFWDSWNAQHREQRIGAASERQAATILGWIGELAAASDRPLEILEIGCGSGWMSERLAGFGHVTGVDLAAEVMERARRRAPKVRFVAGDFMTMDLPQGGVDVAVGLEVLSHVADQPAFVRRICALLRSGGYLMLATQNRFVLERSTGVAPRAPGQIRKWVNARELRTLLEPRFRVLQLTSVLPHGHLGLLRLVNSPRLNGLMARFVPQARIDGLKERWLLGHTLMALARKNA